MHFFLIVCLCCRVLFRGLRVRIGVHIGFPRVTRNIESMKNVYTGPIVSVAANLTSLAHGGQVAILNIETTKCLAE